MTRKIPRCTRCPVPDHQRICRIPGGIGPADCPTRVFAEILEKDNPESWDDARMKFAREASIQERSGYRMDAGGNRRPAKTRIEEIGEFAVRMEYEKLGIAFCAGLHHEAALASNILENWGFTVAAVVCKVGCVDKSRLGLDERHKLRNDPGHESMCHPSAQAEVLNRSHTDLNILLGLCVGHDAVFIHHSKAPVTVLVAKDRVTGHNPAAGLYTSHSYYPNMRPDNLISQEGKTDGAKDRSRSS